MKIRNNPVDKEKDKKPTMNKRKLIVVSIHTHGAYSLLNSIHQTKFVNETNQSMDKLSLRSFTEP